MNGVTRNQLVATVEAGEHEFPVEVDVAFGVAGGCGVSGDGVAERRRVELGGSGHAEAEVDDFDGPARVEESVALVMELMEGFDTAFRRSRTVRDVQLVS